MAGQDGNGSPTTTAALFKRHVSYRKVAFQNYDSICAHCGFGIAAILEVAHLDCNRSNNAKENYDGEEGKRLVAWLNALPKVQAIVAAEFGGNAIREQNLSEWKQGGYRDWVVIAAPPLSTDLSRAARKAPRAVSDPIRIS
jgi:hypothetical protein